MQLLRVSVAKDVVLDARLPLGRISHSTIFAGIAALALVSRRELVHRTVALGALATFPLWALFANL